MKELYEIIYKIYKLNPWKMLNETDLVQFIDKDETLNMVSFVDEEIKAINVFNGIEACGNFVTSLRIDENNSDYSALRYLDAYSIYFVEADKIDDKKPFLDFDFNEESGYPIISRNMYGYFQRLLNEEEKKILINILNNIYLILDEKSKKNIKVDSRLDTHLSRLYDKSKKKFINVVSELFDIRSGIKPIDVNIDFEVKPSKKTVEIDVVILPKIDKKIMLMALACDSEGNILYENVTDEYVSRANLLSEMLIDVLKKNGAVNLVLRDRIDQAYLAKIIKQARLNYEVRALTILDSYADKTVEDMIKL